jgi:hypothetical protein
VQRGLGFIVQARVRADAVVITQRRFVEMGSQLISNYTPQQDVFAGEVTGVTGNTLTLR